MTVDAWSRYIQMQTQIAGPGKDTASELLFAVKT